MTLSNSVDALQHNEWINPFIILTVTATHGLQTEEVITLMKAAMAKNNSSLQKISSQLFVTIKSLLEKNIGGSQLRKIVETIFSTNI